MVPSIVLTRTHSYLSTSALSSGLSKVGIQDSGYRGHSFRRGAAQNASDIGMFDSEIQTLSRCSLTALHQYFTLSTSRLRQLNFQFQTSTILSSNSSIHRLLPPPSLFGHRRASSLLHSTSTLLDPTYLAQLATQVSVSTNTKK
jgi:hypothetical protein